MKQITQDVYFLAVFIFLCSHVYYMSGDAWKEGGMDATGKKLCPFCVTSVWLREWFLLFCGLDQIVLLYFLTIQLHLSSIIFSYNSVTLIIEVYMILSRLNFLLD